MGTLLAKSVYYVLQYPVSPERLTVTQSALGKHVIKLLRSLGELALVSGSRQLVPEVSALRNGGLDRGSAPQECA